MSRLVPGGLALISWFVFASCGNGDDPSTPTEQSPPVPTSITVETSTDSLSSLGQTVPLEATVLDQNGGAMINEPVEWATATEEVLAVLNSGVAIAVGVGEGVVEARAGEAKGAATIKVSGEDGSQIIYVTQIGSVSNLYRKSEAGGEEVQLTFSGDTPSASPQWAPDGRSIVFARRLQGLWLIDADGENRRQVMDIQSVGSPTWSPDSNLIAYEVIESNQWEVHRIRPDGVGRQSLTDGEGGVGPAWSPDGSRIAFTRFDTQVDRSDTWVMNSDGSDQTNVTESIDSEFGVWEWSPDGRYLVGTGPGVSSAEGDIYVLDLKGGPSLTSVTDHPARDDMPTWSPDGARIAFYSERDEGTGNIFIMNADGSDVTQFTFNGSGTYSYHPNWFKPIVGS